MALSGCGKEPEPQEEQTQEPIRVPPPEGAEAPANGSGSGAAQKYFDTQCATCHGTTGDGDGPGAAALDPKPRAFADPTWQADVTDEHIKKIIVEGGPAVGKSAGMPAHPDLKDKAELLDGLVKLIRDFKR